MFQMIWKLLNYNSYTFIKSNVGNNDIPLSVLFYFDVVSKTFNLKNFDFK